MVGIVTALWPPKIVRLQLHVFSKDPGNVTDALLDLASGEVLIIDSITICGLGFVDPSCFERAIVVSKYIPNIRKAYDVARRLYRHEEFIEIAENYLRRVKCVKKGNHKLCLAPYGISFEDALKIVEERTFRRGLPEEVIMAHEMASGIGRWLTRAPSRL